MKIPFFIVCRQEELWETISKILSQLTSNTNDSKMNQLQIKLRKDNSNHAMRKFDETVRSLIDSQLFGKKAMKINRIQRFSQNQPKDDTYQINDVLSWCFKVSGSIDMTTALAQEEERRSVTEQWIMPNFQSAQFNDIIQIVLDELNKISPSKATQAKKIFKQESCKTGTGMVPLYLTRDLIAYAHNITGQHILNINKKIFIENDALFSQIGPSWCLNQMNSHKRKSNRRALKSSNSSVDQQIEQVDNDEQFQLKKKRKRDEDN
ncbi:MAG: hypothetical protein EZS28_014884 [Streblomastix strix]|uniref:Uncharacterized protein n=1 Tax=Streblomastix strix TaxID=222440 RepID=A0A5J4W428_9EUKA|nr:MAG: hypothetical protein EZS28_014884 [Streblomastix strix]